MIWEFLFLAEVEWLVRTLTTGAGSPGFKILLVRRIFQKLSLFLSPVSLQNWGRSRRRGRGVVPHLSYTIAGTS